ncbi:hypothetical protein GCM10011487_62200 [Steroidobacter agaridevorans]|uniref:Uncharacterized protein n=1 Tax=Steroidobacter agaridevorans TaxID=2695856 RepID=A0A829YLV0_9GAMM|nr:hypothetical protein [Steroidobacter agaridevorans]GFE84220.1 hypothetical protein GCM10011487_62200 [Steroidobacter agaridevorans]GFE87045.1 hypothetical protein GCM10011488_19990 [Steroidobacter agaridevorans]
MRSCFVLLLCWLAFKAEAGCSADTKGNTDYPTSRITLQKRTLQEFYYYRADHYAIVVEPATLVRKLEERIRPRAKGASSPAQRLLKDIRDGLPAGNSKDLFVLLLKDALYLVDMELLLADILESGQATVIDAWELPNYGERFVPATQLTRIKRGAYRSREFCTPDGNLLLRVTDAIE